MYSITTFPDQLPPRFSAVLQDKRAWKRALYNGTMTLKVYVLYNMLKVPHILSPPFLELQLKQTRRYGASVHFGVVVVELINCKCGGIVRNQIW